MSAERSNHFADAEENLRAIGESLAAEVNPQLTVAEMIALAQLQASLALVEQQRIANLIALAGLPKVDGFENEVYDASTEALMEGLLASEEVPAVPGYGPAGIEQRVFIRPAIREALGLS